MPSRVKMTEPRSVSRWATAIAIPLALALATACTSPSVSEGERIDRQITSDFQQTPDWSGDGHYIKFWRFLANTDGSGLQEISSSWPDDKYVRDLYIDISPDFSRMAYTTYSYDRGLFRNRDSDIEIATSNLDGTSMHRLTRNERGDYLPTWSPDGTKIAFLSDKPGESQIGQDLHVMASDGSDARRLTSELNTAKTPAVWSPDGESAAFVAYELGEKDGQPWYKTIAYTIRWDGAQLTRLGETHSQPAWSDDSRRLAFITSVNGQVAIHVVNSDGSRNREIVQDNAPLYYIKTEGWIHHVDWMPNFSWSPDGSQVMWGNSPVVLADLDGGNPRTILEGRRRMHTAWSPDGTRIAVHATDAGIATTGYSGDVLFTVTSEGRDKRLLVKLYHGKLVVQESHWEEVFQDIEACSEGKIVPIPTVNSGLARDCETLLRIRNTLAGEGGDLNWNENNPIRYWNGVMVEGTPPRVVSLTLSGSINQLNGALPTDIGRLDRLTYLGIVSTQIRGEIPPELGNLTNLEGLDLFDNQLTGPIPESLGELPNLTKLSLQANQLTGCIPASMANNPDLAISHDDLPDC